MCSTIRTRGDWHRHKGVRGGPLPLYRIMSILKEFFTPKQEPAPPLSVVLHPFYPQSLLLPGYEPLTIPFDQILGIFFGVTAIVFIAVWLLSGASLPSKANSTFGVAAHGNCSEYQYIQTTSVE